MTDVPRRLSGLLAGAVTAVAFGALVGWYAQVELLTTVAPGYASMKPNTALCLGLLGVAIFRYSSPTAGRRLPAVAAATAGSLAALTFVEIVTGTDLGVDHLLPGIDLRGGGARMAPATSMSIQLLSIGVVASSRRAGPLLRMSSIAAFGAGYVSVLGYLYDVSSLYTVRGYTSMALHTALSITGLSVALLLTDPDRGMVGLLRERGGAGRLVRGLLPFLMLGPPVMGWLLLRGQLHSWYDTPFGVAILTMAMTIGSVALLWRTAGRVREADHQRDAAQDELERLNTELEQTVRERTADLAATRDDLQTVIRLAPVGIVRLNADGAFLESNDQWASLSGLTEEQSAGEGWAQAVHPDDLGRVRQRWRAAVDSSSAFLENLRFVHADGTTIWVLAQAEPLLQGSRVSGFLATITDVSDVRQAEQEAVAAQARFEAVFASSPLGSALTSTEGVVMAVNRLLPVLCDRPVDALLGTTIDGLFTDDGAQEDLQLRAALLAGDIRSYQVERQLRRAGAPLFVQATVAVVHDEAGITGLVHQLEDITMRRLAENRAEHMALHDSLTDLPNRLLLLDRLAQALHQAARTGRGVGVLFIDLDRFKVVNDSMGHHAGDLVLTEVAHRLRRHARASDTVARLGGDEFIVVCPDVGSERDVLEIASAVREAVAKPISVGDARATVDASIGVAFGVGHDDPETLLRNADQAMYRAKDRGRARFEVFDEDLRSRLNRRLDTELALRGAAERNELETWFQPIVELDTGRVAATEALARWRRPDIGLVLPVEFIRVAEEVGLIKEVGRTVLRQACLAVADLVDGPAVSVNVSAKQFVRDDFQAVVEDALAVSRLDPRRLWLELTESAVVEALDSAARSFQALRSQGIRIAIDDFGTGFSSFAHLRNFPVDLVKVDMTFVSDLERSARDRAIVEGMVQMATALQLDVVAEGIETTGQRDVLRGFGCRYGQGLLFASPSPIADPQVSGPLLVPQPRATEVAPPPAGAARPSL